MERAAPGHICTVTLAEFKSQDDLDAIRVTGSINVHDEFGFTRRQHRWLQIAGGVIGFIGFAGLFSLIGSLWKKS